MCVVGWDDPSECTLLLQCHHMHGPHLMCIYNQICRETKGDNSAQLAPSNDSQAANNMLQQLAQSLTISSASSSSINFAVKTGSLPPTLASSSRSSANTVPLLPGLLCIAWHQTHVRHHIVKSYSETETCTKSDAITNPASPPCVVGRLRLRLLLPRDRAPFLLFPRLPTTTIGQSSSSSPLLSLSW